MVPLAHPRLRRELRLGVALPGVAGFRGAVLVMTLAVYPLVYLPVAASLRNADPGQEEVARSLGAGRLRTFWRITVGQARVAILGGCLLVALVILAEYGAFEILGYRTFTTEIFTRVQVGFNVPAACALSLVLVVLGLVVLAGERPLTGAGAGSAGRVRWPTRAPSATRAGPGHAAGPARLRGCSSVCALGVPVGAVVYWIVRGGRRSTPVGASLCSRRVAHRRATAPRPPRWPLRMALPVALLVAPPPPAGTGGSSSDHLPGAGHARAGHRPGALLLLRALRSRIPLPERPLLIVAYAIMFFPLALVGVRASVAQAPAGLEEVARSLGTAAPVGARAGHAAPRRPGPRRGVLPRLPPAVTELTATLCSSRPTRRRSPPSSGRTSRTSPTARRPRSRS